MRSNSIKRSQTRKSKVQSRKLPLLFLLYTAELLQVIEARGLLGHAYADDTLLYGSCLPSKAAALRSNVLQCIEDVTAWTASNRLELNPDKTEFMW